MKNSHPILFSTDMVIANQKGIKTKTRRIVKPQPNENGVSFMKSGPVDWESIYHEEWTPYKWETKEGESISKNCPFGEIGDTLWVRETFCYAGDNNVHDCKEDYYTPIYRSSENGKDFEENCDGWRWRPSIFMPREASRMTLEITDIRVERLQDISEQDAIAEGIMELQQSNSQLLMNGRLFFDYSKKKELFNEGLTAKESYKSLWNKINGKDSWDSNPWVWIIGYKKI